LPDFCLLRLFVQSKEGIVLSKWFRIQYAFLVLAFLFAVIIVGAEGQDPTLNFQHLNTQVLNDYIAAMIREQEPAMKEAVMNGAPDISDFKLNDAAFDINSGKLSLNFTVIDKGRDISGALGFEARVSNEAEVCPGFGGYCLGIEGKLHSSQILTNLLLNFTTGHINKSLKGREFWADKQKHKQYRVFRNDNLTDIVNQALVAGDAAGQFPKINKSVPGGTLEADFNNISCRFFNGNAGQAQITSGISAIMIKDSGKSLKFPDTGSMQADFDFYLNPADQSWWAKLSKFKLTINLPIPQFNDLIQGMIDRHLKEHPVLIPLAMPKTAEKANP
jgi:hypothetical protein